MGPSRRFCWGAGAAGPPLGRVANAFPVKTIRSLLAGAVFKKSRAISLLARVHSPENGAAPRPARHLGGIEPICPSVLRLLRIV